MSEKFEVVISGMSGRFPECNDVNALKEKLFNGGDFITTDNRKWPVGYKHKLDGEKMVPDATGKLPNIHKFDRSIFSLSKKNAKNYDILNRLVLEPSFEAIVDAGINPYSLSDRNIAVFMSSCTSEIINNCLICDHGKDSIPLLGHNKTMLSNAVSFALNLRGPSLTNYVDAHGGFDSLATAYKNVSEGLVEAAIVGVSSSIVDPRFSVQYSMFGILSPDGITRPFDERANGYARSEAVICFYIQRAEDAKRNYGEILFCDSYYCGSILPNFIRQDEEYFKAAVDYIYKNKKNPRVDPSDIAFVEMNAYGHKKSDESELNAVAEILSKNRKDSLLVGSVKSNLGHVGETAGLMSVLKGLLVLDSDTVIPNRLPLKIDDKIRAFKRKQLQVATEKTKLPGNTIAVNSFGLLGSVGHAVIQQNKKLRLEESSKEPFPRILLLCGREEDKLRSKLIEVVEKQPYGSDFVVLANDVFVQDMPHHRYRGFTVLPSLSEPVIEIGEKSESNRPIWFIFAGMGSQWLGMGRNLLKLPLFAEIVAKCDEVLREKNIDIYEILTTDKPAIFENILNSFVGIITVQIGLYELLKALGIQPDGIIGHSVGENACGYADGCLSLREAVLASWARGSVSIEESTIRGMMASVGKSYHEIKDTLPKDIEVACHNSADNCTLSGPVESVNALVQELQDNRIFARSVNVSNIAYHSKYIAALGPKLLSKLKQIITKPKQRSPKWVCTSQPECDWDTPMAKSCSPEYLTTNLVNPVFFEEGCKYIPANAICIEIAPHGLLQAILKRSFPRTCTNIPLTSRRTKQGEDLQFFLSAIGKLYITGLEPRVNEIFPKIEYPVHRGTPSLSTLCTWHHEDEPVPRDFTVQELPKASDETIPIEVHEDSQHAYLRDHKINDKIMIPPSFFMYFVWRILSHDKIEELGSSPIAFENVTVHNEVFIEPQEIKYLSVMIRDGSGKFEVILRDQEDSKIFDIILTGQIHVTRSPENIMTQSFERVYQIGKSITKPEFYKAFENVGCHLGEEFTLLQDLHCSDSECETNVTWRGNWVTFLDALMKIQMFVSNDQKVNAIYPTYIRRLEIFASKFSSYDKGTILPCKVVASTNELFCSGIRMCDLKYKILPEANKKLVANDFKFVSFQNPDCENVHEFFNFCLQISVENLATYYDRCRNKLVVIDTTSKYSEILEQIISKEELLKSSIVLHSLKKPLSGNECILIITDSQEKMKNFLVYEDRLLTLAVPGFFLRTRDVTLPHNIRITSQSFSGNTFTLFKQQCTRKDEFWVSRSTFEKKTMEDPETRDKMATLPCFMVCNDIKCEDISKFVKITNKEPTNLRYLYILDELKDEQRLNQLIEEQIKFNLPVSVFKNGTWGSYKCVSNSQKLEYKESLEKTVLSYSASFQNIDYICVHNENIRNGLSFEQIPAFAYSSFTNENEIQIGFARVSKTGILEYDEYLSWTVPSKWGLKEAVTVPYTYGQAYNLLFNSTHASFAETVMINVGSEFLLAEAIVTLALHENLTVFLTVSTVDEKDLFAKKFPQIKSRIFYSESYETHVLQQTNNEGVDIVINCLEGIEHVNATLRCVKNLGCYFEVGSRNCRNAFDKELCLHDLSRFISFYTVGNEESDLLNLTADLKQTMKTYLEEGISSRVVVPPEIKFTNLNQTVTTKIVNVPELRQKNEKIQTANSQIKYDGERLYVVVGTDVKQNLCFELIKWLITRGARKFMLILERFELSDQINHLFVQKGVKCEVKSLSHLNDPQNATVLVKEIRKLAPLEAVFFVSLEDEKKISNLSKVISPEVHFVGLCSNGLEEFEQRRSRGSSAILIHFYQELEDVSAVFPHINDLQVQQTHKHGGVLYSIADLSFNKNTDFSSIVAHPTLNDYLPSNVETLNAIGRNISEEPEFIEEESLSRKYSYCKGIFPIFTLSAVHSIILQPLHKQLLYPVFSATGASTYYSIEEAAIKLYQSLKGIQPTGPVTIISETWTLPLAIQLISHLQGRKYKIFALESNPKNWMNQVDKLQSLCCKEQLDRSYLNSIFHFHRKMEKPVLAENISFENKIKVFAENLSSDTTTVKNLVRAAKMIRTKISQLNQPEFGDKLLKNIIFLERYQPDNRVFNLSVTSRTIVLNEPNYQGLLTNAQVAEIINKNAEFDWLN